MKRLIKKIFIQKDDLTLKEITNEVALIGTYIILVFLILIILIIIK